LLLPALRAFWVVAAASQVLTKHSCQQQAPRPTHTHAPDMRPAVGKMWRAATTSAPHFTHR
jgi:hypothetical protein